MRCAALLLLCGLAASCGAPDASRAFYYWRTRVSFSAAESDALARLHVNKLYLRFFDVDAIDGGPARPVAKVALGEGARLPAGVELVPVVFLKNRALQAQDQGELAGHIWREVQALSAALGAAPREVQLDCDWTGSTRAAYFALLRRLGELARPQGVALSATIRLHQVKYRERTGVPPVERGMLMFYNVGAIGPEQGQRSIYHLAVAEKYLARLPDYPLPLDVALPVFSWTVHLRGDRVEGLLQSTDPAELTAVHWLRPLGPQRWLATRSAFLHGTLLREGDELKAEVISPAAAQQAAAQVARRLPPKSSARTVSLFELNERNLSRHDLPGLERLFATVR